MGSCSREAGDQESPMCLDLFQRVSQPDERFKISRVDAHCQFTKRSHNLSFTIPTIACSTFSTLSFRHGRRPHNDNGGLTWYNLDEMLSSDGECHMVSYSSFMSVHTYVLRQMCSGPTIKEAHNYFNCKIIILPQEATHQQATGFVDPFLRYEPGRAQE